MPLDRECTSAVLDCLNTGQRWLGLLEHGSSFDAAAYLTSAMSEVDADLTYLESESFDFAQAIPVLREVRDSLALEAHVHIQPFAECLRNPRGDGCAKVAFTAALLREAIDVLSRYVIEQRVLTSSFPGYGGLDVRCTAAVAVALFLMSTHFRAANDCDAPAQQGGYDVRWPLQIMEEYVLDLDFAESSGDARVMVKSVYESLSDRVWVGELNECGAPAIAV